MTIAAQNIVSITEVSRNFPKVLKKLPRVGYLIVMKNYKPVAKISAPHEAVDDDGGILMLREIREKAWGTYTQEIETALANLETTPEQSLPLLLRRKTKTAT